MKYVRTSQFESYLHGRSYTSIHRSGSVIGMKKLYGWNRASEIIRSGNYIYAIWD